MVVRSRLGRAASTGRSVSAVLRSLERRWQRLLAPHVGDEDSERVKQVVSAYVLYRRRHLGAHKIELRHGPLVRSMPNLARSLLLLLAVALLARLELIARRRRRCGQRS